MAIAFLLLALLVIDATTAAPPKVIIMALADDYGFNNVGFPHGPNNAGNPEAKTPNVDRLVMTEGVRLERHYVYKYCSPTRAALMTGRVPMHVNQNNKCNDALSDSGIDLRMTIMPQKFKSAGWATAMIGKWHGGARSIGNLPTSRGYDYHLGFLKGGEDHFKQDHCAGGPDATTVDLWADTTPAWGQNGTYSATLYSRAAINVIQNFSQHNPIGRDKDTANAKGLFLYLPWHCTHTPLEAPEEYFYPPYYPTNYPARVQYNAMARALDDAIGNVTDVLKSTNLWQDTLWVQSADNGGWLITNGGATNYPLRGGKVTDFEGGVRALSFMMGGYLNPQLHGTSFSGFISVSDWYATFCGLLGVDPADGDGSIVPAIDSIDVWAALQVPNGTTTPRSSLPLSFCPDSTLGCHLGDNALIEVPYKIVCGPQEGMGYHQWPGYPNGTYPTPDVNCTAPNCCLFNILDDPNESKDLREAEPEAYANMTMALAKIGATVYQTAYAEPNTTQCLSYAQGKKYYHGFIGPLCFAQSPIPPAPPPKPFLLQSGDLCLGTRNTSIVAKQCSSDPAADKVWFITPSDSLEDEPGSGWLFTVTEQEVRYVKIDEHTAPNVTKKADFCRRGRVYLNPDAGHVATAQGFTINTTSASLQSTYCDSDLYRCLVVPTNGTAAHGGSCDDPQARWKQVF